MEHKHENNRAGYLGFFDSVAAVEKIYPDGGQPGDFFTNGETASMWMWNPKTLGWTNMQGESKSVLQGVITDPETFVPNVKEDEPAYYLYVAPGDGEYSFPQLKDIFGEVVTVSTDCHALVSLFWTGRYWEASVTSLNLNPLSQATYTSVKYCITDTDQEIPKMHSMFEPGPRWLPHILTVPKNRFLWMTTARFNMRGELVGSWSRPVLLTGRKGDAGAVLRNRGNWNEEEVYECNEKWIDVVRYEQHCYKVKENGVTAIAPPDATCWELADECLFIADLLDLRPGQSITISDRGRIMVGGTQKCWLLMSGKIMHIPSGIEMDDRGNIKIPDSRGNGTFELSTNHYPFRWVTSQNEELVKLEMTDSGPCLSINTYYSGSIEHVMLNRQGLVMQSISTDTGEVTENFYFGKKGMRLSLKDAPDEEYDIYVDENNFVRYSPQKLDN